MSAFGYYWVEVGDDGEELNFALSQRMIVDFIQRKKLLPRGLFPEDRSESILPFDQRKIGQEIDKKLRKGDLLIIPSQDCLFRTAADGVSIYQKFRKRGIRVHSLDLKTDIIFGPQAEFIQSVLQPLARSESSLTSDRIRKLKQSRKAEGRYLGGKIQFGFKVDKVGKMIPDPKQQAAIKRIMTLRAEGLSLRAIADEMKRRGIQISHVNVKATLNRH